MIENPVSSRNAKRSGTAKPQAPDGERPTSVRMLAFLFTDVEGSTRTWERSPDAMRTALTRHDAILARAIEEAGGRVVKSMGDGVMAVFESANDGLVAGLTAQRALVHEPWPEGTPIRVRMGLHVGEATGDGSDFHGPAVNRTARIMAAGHGGQVLLSGTTTALVLDRLPAGASLRDLGEHHLRDLARPERVYQLVHPDLPDAFPVLSTVEERHASLPAEPSAFIGRESERASMAQRLGDSQVRLVTLTGPGGVGKTRLAIRVARDIEDRFASGAAFVDLSEARDLTTMLTTMARALGYSDLSDASRLDDLASRIGRQQLLIVLDNFEQVAIAAPALSQLLRECPELKLLVTSREALHVTGEHVFPVDPMTVPRATGTATARQVEPFEAVRLFVERARAVKPDFRVTDGNAAVVAEICRRLDGVPLAIELATARLKVFSLEALRDRLQNRLAGLGSGARDLPQRQQTLRATIDWSYQLLTVGEQRLFELLGAFWGADIDAIEGVASAAGALPPGTDPIDALSSLVDKSLVRRTERDEGEPRFEMLGSILEFAAERLDERADDATRVRSAHADHFATLAASDRVDDPLADRSILVASLGLELENLRAAWRWSVAERDVSRLERLHGGLRAVYDARGWYGAISDLAADVLGVLGSVERTPAREVLAIAMRSEQARALTALEGYTAEVEAAYERLLESVADADVPQTYPILRSLAGLYSFRGEDERASELARRILRLAEERDDPAMRADGNLLLGTGVAFARIPDGIPILEAGIASAPDGRDVMPMRLGPDPRVATHTALSLLLLWAGRHETSIRHSQDAMALAERLGHPSSLGYALFHAALLRLWRDEPDEARQLAVRCVEYAQEHGLRIWAAVGTVITGAAATELGLAEEGVRWIEEGLERYRGLRTPPIFWPFLLRIRATAFARAGRVEDASAAITEALTLAPRDPNLHVVHGDLLLASGRAAEALAAYEGAARHAAAWGASMTELRANVRAFGADPTEERRARIRDALAGLTEGLDMPELVAARAIADGDGLDAG